MVCFYVKTGSRGSALAKPFEDFAKNQDAKPPSTLLRIYSKLIPEVVSGSEKK